MDTRKLLTALAITCSSLTLFAAPPSTPWSIAQVAPSLQLVITSFSAPPNEEIEVYQDAKGSNVIKWQGTGSDIEYLLQGSKDGLNFRLIKKVTATTKPQPALQYETTDNTGKGYSHFRVIRIDRLGLVSYSKTASAPQ